MLLEGTAAIEQLVGHHPQTPVVGLGSVHMILGEHLRRQVLLGSAGQVTAERLAGGRVRLDMRHSEVCQVCISPLIKNYIL